MSTETKEKEVKEQPENKNEEENKTEDEYDPEYDPEYDSEYYSQFFEYSDSKLKYTSSDAWEGMCRHKKFNEAFFNKCIANPVLCKNINWYMLLQNKYLPEAFFEKLMKNKEFKDREEWYYLVYNQNLKESFFNKHMFEGGKDIKDLPFLRDLGLSHLCEREDISQAFIEKLLNNDLYKDKIPWSFLATNRNLKQPFFEKYLKQIYIGTIREIEDYNVKKNIKKNGGVSGTFKKDIYNGFWGSIAYRRDMSEQFFSTLIEFYVQPMIFDSSYSYFTINLCKNPSMSEMFFERNVIPRIGRPFSAYSWVNLCENNCLSEEFYKRHLSDMKNTTKNIYTYCLTHLTTHPNITENFIEEFIMEELFMMEEFNRNHIWWRLSRSRNLSQKFWQKYLLKMLKDINTDRRTILSNIIENPNITEEFRVLLESKKKRS
jgi:hypothetical protein